MRLTRRARGFLSRPIHHARIWSMLLYFSGRRLLHASDTLVINPDRALYDPELMREVQQVVDREHLNVEKVYSMHQEPASWNDVVSLIGKAMS